MIRSFGDRRTRRFFEGQRVAVFQRFAAQATRRLTLLDNAAALQDLAALPSNRLEALHGDRAGSYSIRHAVAPVFSADGAYAVEIGALREEEHDTKNGMRPVHPGEILREELDVRAVGQCVGEGAGCAGGITQILHGQRGVTADTSTVGRRHSCG